MNKIKKANFSKVFVLNKKKKKKKIDGTTIFVFLIVFALVAFGCLMVYSASFYTAVVRYGNEYFFLFKQLLGVGLGIFAMIFFTFFDYHLLKKFRYIILAVCVVLLILVFVP